MNYSSILTTLNDFNVFTTSTDKSFLDLYSCIFTSKYDITGWFKASNIKVDYAVFKGCFNLWSCLLAFLIQVKKYAFYVHIIDYHVKLPWCSIHLVTHFINIEFIQGIALLERLRMLFLAGSGSALPDVVGVVGGSVVLKKL